MHIVPEETRHKSRRPAWAARSPARSRLYRIGVGIAGGIVLAAGVVMIPYPGPGWLVVFAGLAILATEFAWAHGVLTYARGKYDAWNAWIKRQHTVVQAATFVLTTLVVLATLWLLNVYALVGGWLGIEWSWLRSPLFG